MMNKFIFNIEQNPIMYSKHFKFKHLQGFILLVIREAQVDFEHNPLLKDKKEKKEEEKKNAENMGFHVLEDMAQSAGLNLEEFEQLEMDEINNEEEKKEEEKDENEE